MVQSMLSMLPSWSYDPPFAPQFIIGLGVLLAVFAAVAYFRTAGTERRGLLLLLLRLASIGLATLILLRPQQDQAVVNDDQPRPFLILADTSASMNTKDTKAGTRWEQTSSLLSPRVSNLVRSIEQTNPVYFYALDETAKRQTDIELFSRGQREIAEGLTTDLGGGLLAVAGEFGDRPCAGALLVSDGRDHGGQIGSAIEALRANTIPMWTTCIGQASEQSDVFVSARLAQSYLYAGQAGRINVRLDQSGFDGRYATVVVRREGEIISKRQLQLSRGALRFSVPVTETETGVVRYEVDVSPIEGEANPRNNQRTVFVRVINEKAKILLVEAQPNWDSKFLLRALQADPNINATSIFYLEDNRSYGIREHASENTLDKEQELGPVSLPTRRTELYGYDCLILGKDVDRLFEAHAPGLLDEYVRDHGGAVVFYRGRPYSDRPGSLPALEPVRWKPGQLKDVELALTASGRLSSIFDFRLPLPADSVVRSLPNVVSVSRTAERKSLATVLAVGSDGGIEQAAIAHHRVGAGKVMTIAANGLWRWSFLPQEREDVETVYQTLWSQIVRWALQDSDFLPGQSISFRTNRRSFKPGESVRFAVRTRNLDADQRFEPRIVLVTPDGGEQVLLPQSDPDQTETFSTVQTLVDVGEYQATLWLNETEAHPEPVRFTAYPDSLELQMTSSDPDTLARIADSTGGSLLKADELNDLPTQIARVARATKADTAPEDIWDVPTWFFTLVVLLGLEWFIRRRGGFA